MVLVYYNLFIPCIYVCIVQLKSILDLLPSFASLCTSVCFGNKAKLALFTTTFQMELKTDDQQVPVQTPTTEKKPRGRPRKVNKIVSIKIPALRDCLKII